MITEETIEKWRKLGLTEGMEESKVPKLAQLYENAVDFLTKQNDEQRNGYTETLTFPILYRAVRETDLDSNIIVDDVITIIDNNFERLVSEINQESTENIDAEAEAARQVSELIIEQIKNK